ncbi:MAG: acyltransferase [Solirubrobacteraceae bacterium]
MFWVNTLAASPYVRSASRIALYRRLGMDISAEGTDIGPSCYIHSDDLRVGSHTTIKTRCWFENVGRLTIGDRVGVGPHTVILTSTHELGSARRRYGKWHYLPVTIGDGCWIGARTLIHPGVTVGHGCIVAAGSVVNRDTEPDCLYAGVPARKIRHLDDAESLPQRP